MRRYLGGIVLLALVLPLTARAEVMLPRVIADHMILQRGAAASIWGWADAGEGVAVEFAGQTKRAVPNAEGRWQVALDPMEASSQGREMRITGTNEIILMDVLVGEVWLASGQSNMVSGIKQVPGDERAVYNALKSSALVRLFLQGRPRGAPVRAMPTAAGCATLNRRSTHQQWASSSRSSFIRS
jgi:hypothetical protein